MEGKIKIVLGRHGYAMWRECGDSDGFDLGHLHFGAFGRTLTAMATREEAERMVSLLSYWQTLADFSCGADRNEIAGLRRDWQRVKDALAAS